ncbi:MAG TPA: hypothetical protein PKA88_17740 [Polyangiaceae bacterium]|nr:hypothetical protein [Polyangiaceae bacterium]HMR75400.1 hypothetical protein [Polyangiaceae bacterium]
MKARGLLLLALGLNLFSCSSEKDGAAAVDPYRSEESFCGEWAKAACNKSVVNKCSGGGDDTEACVQKQTSFCLAALPENYAPTKAKTCVEAVRKAYSDAKLTADEIKIVRAFAAPCNQLSKGPKSEGDSCLRSSDCDTVAEVSCVIRPGDSEGSCEVPVEAGGGDPCSEKHQVCADTHYCDGSNCLTKVQEGKACDASMPCAPGLRCADMSGAFTCISKLSTAATCTADDECVSGVCAKGKGATEGTCVETLELGVTVGFCGDLS